MKRLILLMVILCIGCRSMTRVTVNYYDHKKNPIVGVSFDIEPREPNDLPTRSR